MKNIKQAMMRAILTTSFCISMLNMNAQSTVYFFCTSTGNNECILKFNGKEIGELRGPLKKTMDPTPPMKMPYKTYSACTKKCIFKEEGKALFAVDYKFTNAVKLTTSDLYAEIQLNLSENSIHYVKLTSKGLNNIQFKEISEKEAQKLLKDSKYVSLSDYIQE